MRQDPNSSRPERVLDREFEVWGTAEGSDSNRVARVVHVTILGNGPQTFIFDRGTGDPSIDGGPEYALKGEIRDDGIIAEIIRAAARGRQAGRAEGRREVAEHLTKTFAQLTAVARDGRRML